MSETLEKILDKYNLQDQRGSQIIEIPNTTRTDLALLFTELGFNKGVELGTEAGLYAEVLLKANPNLELACVDAWTAYKGYRDHVTQEKLDGIYQNCHERLLPFIKEGRCVTVRGFGMNEVENFKDNSLDFVYIDANHEYCQVVNDITAWEKKVKKGGIVAGHDYIKRKNKEYLMHVIEAVDGYVSAWQIKPYFVLGRKNPPQGEIRESTRSWFWVKE